MLLKTTYCNFDVGICVGSLITTFQGHFIKHVHVLLSFSGNHSGIGLIYYLKMGSRSLLIS